MFDLEREQHRKTYQLCRLGFAITAVGLSVACFASVLGLLGFFQRDLIFRLYNAAWYQWLKTPIVWCALVGATLLWGRWNHASWQRRVGVLLLICLTNLVLWFIAQGETTGLQVGNFGHRWLRENMGLALGWGKFALLSSLACDYLVHLGVEHAGDSDKSSRSMTATGALVWMLYFSQQTAWGAGWPLRPRQIGGVERELLIYGYCLIWTITLIQVTALVISAARQSGHVLREMDREDQEIDLLRSRSDPLDEFDAVVADRDKRS
jgi:hypothetical protein